MLSLRPSDLASFVRRSRLLPFVLIAVIAAFLWVWRSTEKSSPLLRYMGPFLRVTYVGRSDLKRSFSADIHLKNTGLKDIPQDGWVLTFSHINVIEKQALQTKNFLLLANGQLRLSAIQGNLYNLEPTKDFKALLPGDTITFTVKGHLPFTNKYKTVYPNWYVWYEDLDPVIVECTTTDDLAFVQGFDGQDEWTPSDRFERNKFRDLGKFGQAVIPAAVEYKLISHDVILVEHYEVTFPVYFNNEGTHLKRKLAEILHKINSSRPSFQIALKQEKVVFSSLFNTSLLILEHAYSVKISKQGCVIQAENPSGVFYGVQTLLSLLSNHPDHRLPVVNITDAPRYKIRSFMLDVSRNFFHLPEIKLILDSMAMYKLNTLHLHLTDDQGWRLDIPGIPELTQIGSRRCHTRTQEQQHLYPYHGANPSCKYSTHQYYTVNDYVSILKYAKNLHIRVLPEIDFPGHSHAAVVAMAFRTKTSASSRRNNTYELRDNRDTSVHYQVGGYKDTTINPCLSSTYAFLDVIIKALVDIHKRAQPLEYLHLGGDEVPESAFSTSPACIDFISKSGNSIKQQGLQQYFISRARVILHKHGLKLAVWEDGMMTTDKKPLDLKGQQKDVLVNTWRKGVRAFANKGYQVVDSSSSHLYLDHSQDPSQLDRGFNWATNFSDAQKIFEYSPVCFHQNASYPMKAHNIMGLQVCLWTELVWTNSQLERQMFPRLFAFAQKAWHQASWDETCNVAAQLTQKPREDDYERFINSVGYKELPRLDLMGLQYYLPPPGVRMKDGRIEANSAIPGLPILYSLENSSWRPFNKSSLTEQPSGVVSFITTSHDRQRTSQVVRLQFPTK